MDGKKPEINRTVEAVVVMDFTADWDFFYWTEVLRTRHGTCKTRLKISAAQGVTTIAEMGGTTSEAYEGKPYQIEKGNHMTCYLRARAGAVVHGEVEP